MRGNVGWLSILHFGPNSRKIKVSSCFERSKEAEAYPDNQSYTPFSDSIPLRKIHIPFQ